MKKILTLVSVAVILLSSCIHQFPESRPADVVLTLKFDTELSYYKTLAFPDETKAGSPRTDLPVLEQDFSDHESYDLRYTIEAYPRLGNGDFSRDPAMLFCPSAF